MNGEEDEEEESEGIPAVNRLVLSLHFMVVPPPPKEGLTDYLSLPFQMHLGICEYYLPVDNVSPQLILVLFCVRESQMEPESAGRIFGFYLIKLFPSNSSLRDKYRPFTSIFDFIV